MNKKHRDEFNVIFGLTNIKRCLAAAFISITVFPILLLVSVVKTDFATMLLIPVAFFSVGSAAFAYLLHQVAKYKMKQYYEPVTWIYLVAFHIFFAYIALENLPFYFIAVILAAYLVQFSLERYIVMVLGELLCFFAVLVKSGITEISTGDFLWLAGIHLFAFVLSRDFYNIQKKFLLEERKLRREKQEAEHESLTGLMNRRGLERRAEGMWKTIISCQESVAVLAIAVDSFKAYNDHLGRGQSKLFIQKIAKSITSTIKGYGVAAHVSKEEFLVFVRDREAQEISDLAEKIRTDVEAMRLYAGNANGGTVTVSVGFDIKYEAKDVSFQGLCDRADRALYQAQQEGRNSVRSFQDTAEYQEKIG